MLQFGHIILTFVTFDGTGQMLGGIVAGIDVGVVDGGTVGSVDGIGMSVGGSGVFVAGTVGTPVGEIQVATASPDTPVPQLLTAATVHLYSLPGVIGKVTSIEPLTTPFATCPPDATSIT